MLLFERDHDPYPSLDPHLLIMKHEVLVRFKVIIIIVNYNYIIVSMSTSSSWLNLKMCYGVIFTSSTCVIYFDYLHQPHCKQTQNSLI